MTTLVNNVSVLLPISVLVAIGILSLMNGLRLGDGSLRTATIVVNISAWSMMTTALGFPAMLAASTSHHELPGTASAGGFDGRNYYFLKKDRTTTTVTREVWERTYVLEQLGHAMLRTGGATFLCSLVALGLMRWKAPELLGVLKSDEPSAVPNDQT